MKKIFLIFSIVLLISNYIQAQNNYTVILLNGEIKYQSSSKPIKVGEMISKNMSFQFSNKNNYALLINKKNKERAILRKRTNNEVYFAKSQFTSAMSNMTSRSGLCLKNSVDFASHFKDTFAIIYNTNIIFDTDKYPIDSTHFFFISFIDENEKLVYEKLESKKDSLFINSENFNLSKQKNNINTKILYRKNETSYFLSEMTVNLVDKESLKETLNALEKIYKNKKLLNELSIIVNFQYGICQEQDVLSFIKNNK